MKFRKRPVVIEAEQFFPEQLAVDARGMDRLGVEHTVTECVIQTLEGAMRVSPGDWVITGIKGERYPCKPDIFEATYEALPFSETFCPKGHSVRIQAGDRCPECAVGRTA